LIIGIIGDTHFGISKWYEDSIRQGRDAFLKAAQFSDAIIMTGDLFHSSKPNLNVLQDVVNILFETAKSKKWKVKVNGENRVPIIVIHGNHERQTRDNVNPIEFLSSLGLIINADDKVNIIESEDGEKVAVHAMGDIMDDHAKEKLTELNFKPIKECTNIFLFHQSLREAMYMGNKSWLSVKDLPEGFDLYVDGHIHNRKEFSDYRLLIPGSTVITQLEEQEMNEKGIYLYDTVKRAYRFMAIDYRPFIFRRLLFNNESLGDIEIKVKDEVKAILSKDYKMKPIIRIVLEGSVKKGINPRDLKINVKDPNADIILKNNLESQELENKIKMIRELREKKIPVREMGVRIIAEKLGYSSSDSDKLIELSELLSKLEENPDKVLDKL